MMTQPLTTASAVKLPGRVYFALAAGVLAGASAAIFTRLAQTEGAPSLLIAAFRLTFSALILTPLALTRYRAELDEMFSPARRIDLRWAAFAALLMAIHFVAWITSLEYASVLIATVLVTSSPIWAGLIETLFFGVKLTRWVIIGLLAAVVGNIVLTLARGGSGDGPNLLLGSALALFAAMAIALQRSVSRPLRLRLSLVPFLWLLYGIAALCLLPVVLITGTQVFGLSPMAYFWMAMVTLFPQLIGHSVFNYALRYMPATYVSLAIQIEPILSTIAAFVLFREQPAPGQIVGSAIIMAGVITATLARTREGH